MTSDRIFGDAEALIGPVVDPTCFYGLGAKNRLKNVSLGRHTGYPSRKLAKSGDYDQPVPPADSSMTPSQLESLWQDAGDRSQPDPQSWQVSDTKSAEPQILALTVRASPKLVRQVKCTD
ncbi:hypothetical protein Prudu_1456S000100 [Prunus dulcis]|uniref:Uncharacterized protein n=1 Tax=Prunus dulcis TaxID=3755 RepID=A0A5H2XR25_PRUDU|nr:hypothetical protein Prudu_1456S000100 [Prunus dulcis]